MFLIKTILYDFDFPALSLLRATPALEDYYFIVLITFGKY